MTLELSLVVIHDTGVTVNSSFSYPTRPGHHILKNLNLTLPSSKTVAIVGQSGGGIDFYFLTVLE